MQNQIVNSVDIAASPNVIWNIISIPENVSQWFGAIFVQPFEAGQPATAVVNYPGYEGLRFEIVIKELMAPDRLSFFWHPYAIDISRDHSSETPTLVQFDIEAKSGGLAVLTVTESGFDKLPSDRAEEAYNGNHKGWQTILNKISALVARTSRSNISAE